MFAPSLLAASSQVAQQAGPSSISLGSHGDIVWIIGIRMGSSPAGGWHKVGNGVDNHNAAHIFFHVFGKVPHKWIDNDHNTANVQKNTLKVRAG